MLAKCMPDTPIRQPSRMELLYRNPNCIGICYHCGDGIYVEEVPKLINSRSLHSSVPVSRLICDYDYVRVPHVCPTDFHGRVVQYQHNYDFSNPCSSQ